MEKGIVYIKVITTITLFLIVGIILLSYYEYALYKKKVGGAINDVKNIGGGIFGNVLKAIGL